MENLTHTVVGLMLARCGLEKVTPRGAGMLMLAANMPDLDAVSWLGGSTVYLEYHRGPMHSLGLLPIVALLPILLVRAKITWRTWLASMVGVLSHLLLDWTNSFGIPLLWPFSERRLRLDIVNIVDVWIWTILLGALAATALVALVSREMGDKKASGARRGWAVFALLALFGFESLRFASHQKALGVMESRLYENMPPRRVTALPGALDPFLWRGIVETGNLVRITSVDVSPLGTPRVFDPAAGRTYAVIDHIPQMDVALQTHAFRVFNQWAQLPFWQTEPAADGVEVSLSDLRFGEPGSSGFRVRAVVKNNGTVETLH